MGQWFLEKDHRYRYGLLKWNRGLYLWGFFVSNEYIVFTIGGTIALRLSVPTFYDRRATDLQLEKGLTLLLYKFEILSRNDVMCYVWFEIGQKVL